MKNERGEKSKTLTQQRYSRDAPSGSSLREHKRPIVEASADDLNDRFVGVKPDAQVAHAESSSGDCIVSADE